MCGIYGFFDRTGESNGRAESELAGGTLIHRGPDDVGMFSSDICTIGNRRLSIIDVEGGHQPFTSDDGMISVVQNGEIYNHVELAAELRGDGFQFRTHSDTEVLLRLYERDGIDFLNKLNGMFSFAIWDGRQQALYLVRDRVGIKPLYIRDDGKTVKFGSEIKAILAHGGIPEIDFESLHNYLAFNYVPPPRTMFRGIRHLEPGSAVRISKEGSHAWRWWSLENVAAEERAESTWTEEFVDLLDDAVRLRLRCDVPFGAFLSGGVDSSSVVALMARHVTEPVRTFCIGFHDSRFDESRWALMAAQRFGARHEMERASDDILGMWPMAIEHCDQPHGDISFIPTYMVSALAARHVKVVLTGDGGDELFAGYDKYRDFFACPGVDGLPEADFRRTYMNALTLMGPKERAELYTGALSASTSGLDPYSVLEPLFEESAGMDRINQALYIDTKLLLPGNNLVKPDRMAMAVSLEARTPFLDYRMVEFAFRIPGGLKIRDGETKYIYKKAVAPLIGDDLAYRRKQMFTVPVGEWLKREAVDYATDILLSPFAVERGFFEPSVIRRMIDDHREERRNLTRELRALLALEIWCRRLIDDDGAELEEANVSVEV